MSTLTDHGYVEGPTLPPSEKPFPLFWEQNPATDDGHAHLWELVHLEADGRYRARSENVVRCATCLAPRCGHSNDPDPCMRRRHHGSMHYTMSGAARQVGA